MGAVIYYLNLENRKDRDEKMNIKFSFIKNEYNIEFERIDAVNGKNIDINYLIREKYVCESYPNYTLSHLENRNIYRGEIGCLLSHIKSWKTFLESNKNFCIILEDDVSLNHDYFYKYFFKILDSIRNIDIDMLLFGRYVICENGFFTGKNINKFIYEPDIYGYGAFAYLLTRKGAEKLLKYFNTERDTAGGKCKLLHVMDQFNFTKRDYKIIFNEDINIYSVYPQFIIEVNEDRDFTNETKRKDKEFLFYVDDKGDSDTNIK